MSVEVVSSPAHQETYKIEWRPVLAERPWVDEFRTLLTAPPVNVALVSKQVSELPFAV